MLEQHDELVSKLRTELEVVTELVVPAGPDEVIPVDENDEETQTEPSILGMLNED
jgi:hypothetical protein